MIISFNGYIMKTAREGKELAREFAVIRDMYILDGCSFEEATHIANDYLSIQQKRKVQVYLRYSNYAY